MLFEFSIAKSISYPKKQLSMSLIALMSVGVIHLSFVGISILSVTDGLKKLA